LYAFVFIGFTFKQLPPSYGIIPMTAGALILSGLALAEGIPRKGSIPSTFVRGTLALFLAAMLGGVWAYFGKVDQVSLRDCAAYCFTLTVVTSIVITLRGRESRAPGIFGIAISIYLALAIFIAFTPTPLQAHMWYMGVKLQALSNNPNQIALLAALGVSFLTLDEVINRHVRMRNLTACLACAVAGILSDSSAFTAAYLATLFALGVVFCLGGTWRRVGRFNWITKILGVYFVPKTLLLVGIVVAAIFAIQNTSFVSVGNVSDKVSITHFPRIETSLDDAVNSDQGQGAVRFALWRKALTMTTQSPILGLGPGPHILLPGSGVRTEAHNTFLDILVVSGIVGLAAFLYILITTAYGASLNGRAYQVVLIGMPVLVFLLFHFIARQPLFWLLLFLVSQYAWRPKIISPPENVEASS